VPHRGEGLLAKAGRGLSASALAWSPTVRPAGGHAYHRLGDLAGSPWAREFLDRFVIGSEALPQVR
jgi:hypothetical protein